jgi:branched-chain amino acid transport system ATP-binding protein
MSTALAATAQIPDSAGPVLEVRQLTKRFGGLVALDKVSLSVAPGSIHAVIGPNGSGKTTLFNVVSGIYPPSAGEIRFQGRPASGLAPERLARLGLGRTFQNTRLFGSMTVLENVVVVRHRAGAGWRYSRAEQRRVMEILELVGLAEVAGQSAASLPQGLRRLLEIAKALALDPKLILLDEPHGGLNHTETARLIDVIREIHRRGMTILLIEHEMEVVMRLAQAITVLNFGEVLADGPPDAIQRDEAVIEAYLGRKKAAADAASTRSVQPGSAELLQVRDLSVRFGDIEAVRKVSLDVRAGEAVALLGNNGAGKSTTLKAICRLVPAQSGVVTLDGSSLLQQPTERLVGLGIALVPERRRLFGGLTVIENLKTGAYGRPAAEIDARIEEVLALFSNLRRLSKSLAFSLSGGEQQMLAIGRALMSHPKLLLLDEPSLGLAPLLVEQVFAKLAEVNRLGTAILLVEQNARMALSVADRAYVLGSGRIVAEGPAQELAADERVKNAYLGITPA